MINYRVDDMNGMLEQLRGQSQPAAPGGGGSQPPTPQQ